MDKPKRYYIATHHGEAGTIASVIDRKRDRMMGVFSTFRDGAAFSELARIQRDALNRAAIRKATGEE